MNKDPVCHHYTLPFSKEELLLSPGERGNTFYVGSSCRFVLVYSNSGSEKRDGKD
jgi:hypothetical protein